MTMETQYARRAYPRQKENGECERRQENVKQEKQSGIRQRSRSRFQGQNTPFCGIEASADFFMIHARRSAGGAYPSVRKQLKSYFYTTPLSREGRQDFKHGIPFSRKRQKNVFAPMVDVTGRVAQTTPTFKPAEVQKTP
jgi:hypothetical protein